MGVSTDRHIGGQAGAEDGGQTSAGLVGKVGNAEADCLDWARAETVCKCLL